MVSEASMAPDTTSGTGEIEVSGVKPCKVILEDIMKKQTNSKLERLLEDCGDGSKCRIFSCGSKICKLKQNFIARDRCVSSCSLRSYPCITPPGTLYVNCHTSNVIYLITCCKCGLQYVGETVMKINDRFRKHRGSMESDKPGCHILSAHFRKGLCKDSDYTVQIVEKLEGNGRTSRGIIDASQTAKRKEKELEWMLKLRTIYPYGLNDKIGTEKTPATEQSYIGKRFPPLKRNFSRVSRRGNKKGSDGLTHTDFLSKLDGYLQYNLKDTINFIRISITTMKKSQIKLLGSKVLRETLYRQDDYHFQQWYSVVKDIIDCKLIKEKTVRRKRTTPTNICHIDFDNKAVEMLNLTSIFKSPSAKNSIPSLAKDFDVPTVVYNLGSPTASKIFNFNKFVSSLDVENFISNPESIPCPCENSAFRDKHHNHIVTGDLKIVENRKLRTLLSRGPKYRECKTLNFEVAREKVVLGIKECAENFCSSHHLNKNVLLGWVNTCISLLDKRISHLKSVVTIDPVNEVLKDKKCSDELDELKSKFVFVPIDKATGNVALVCKRFYASVLIDELGLKGRSSETYERVRKTSETLVKKNIRDLKDKFGIDVKSENHCLPHIYWLPKLHKKPLKFRFIIAAPKCSVKPLSKAITSVFQQFYKQVDNYNSKLRYYSSTKSFWVIQNNQPVIERLTALNRRGRAKCISTFDFSTLYTKIPHKKLIFVLNEIIDFCFNGNKDFLSVTSSGARWVKTGSKKGITFDKLSFKHAVKYLMDNCFFSFGNQIFRQKIGIPMGSDPAPYFANLFLYHYESKYVQNLQVKDLPRARRFCNTFRFIDDLLAVNDDGEFERCFKEIYPNELELKKEHDGDSVSFLDLQIDLNENRFETSLYDKRDNFPFSIVRMPYKCSNIPSNIFYSSIGAEILRIGRACSSTEAFLLSAQKLIKRMIKQGAKYSRVKKTLVKIFARNAVFLKFADSKEHFLKDILDG